MITKQLQTSETAKKIENFIGVKKKTQCRKQNGRED